MCITDIFILIVFAVFFDGGLAGYDCVERCSCSMKDNVLIADCSARNLTEIPIPKDHQVNVLILNLNQLTRVRSGAFAFYTSLTTVDLSQNKIQVIETGAFHGLGGSNLLHLDLSENYLNQIPKNEIARMSHSLHSLSLASNAFPTFPSYLKDMTELLKFDISNNMFITSLPVDGLPSSLTSLNIAFTSIRHFSKANFRNATTLRELDMSDNSASGAVDFESGTFDNLVRLEHLDLSRCYCRRLPSNSFVKLKNLSTLLLTASRINKLPLFYAENPYFVNISDGPSGEIPRKTTPLLLDQNEEEEELSRKRRSRDPRDSTSTVTSHVAPELDIFGVSKNIWSNPNLRTLDLSNNRRLSIRPSGDMGGLLFPPSLSKLELGYTAVRTLNAVTFSNLENLNYLGMCYSRLSNIAEDAFVALSQLKDLCLSGNSFKNPPKLPDSVENVNMTNTKITNLTVTYLGGLGHLFEADWSKGDIENIEPGAFTNMSKLRFLNLSTNNLQSIMENTFYIKNPQNVSKSSLELLDLSSNSISEIQGRAFSSHGGLRELYLQNNNLEEITDQNFKGLKSLTILNLAQNKIIDIAPKALMDFINLEELVLQQNELEVIFPNQFSASVKLQTLNINDNALVDFQTQNFPSLTLLEIKNNKLTSFPVLKAPLLTHVHAADNTVERLTAKDLHGLPDLMYLDLSENNGLFNFSFNVFKETPHLAYLDLGSNHLDKFVDFVMPSLKTLLISSNSIEEVNEPISRNLPVIQQIDLSLNNIKTINPVVFNSSKTLYSINLAGNNFNCNCELVALVDWMLEHMHNEDIDIVEAEAYMCETPDVYYLHLLLHVVPTLNCKPVVPATASIALDVILVLLTCVVVLASIGIACYCRRRPPRHNVSSASSLTDDTNSEHNSPLHCCSYICTHLCASNVYNFHRARPHRDRVMSDDERRDLMIGSPLTSPSDPDPPELML